ncbi:MAG: thioredoxin family protein [Methylacidiphilales bacterium]|nr:thioredoxin family protein [Candidatus Methylacidiphilales bacterium]
MIRTLLLLLIAGSLAARASDPISVPYGAASAKVSQPHVTAELIPEKTLVEAGGPFDVILHLHMDPGWHTYWINPGDAGLATTIKWTLPSGFTAGPIQWPTPEKHPMGPLMTYGYEGDVYLLTTITPPDSPGSNVTKIDLKARASWLVCKEECIPGKGDLSLSLHFAGKTAILSYPVIWNKDLFAAARARLPVPNLRWRVDASYAKSPAFHGTMPNQDGIIINFENMSETGSSVVGSVRFFPEQPNVLSSQDADNPPPSMYDGGFILSIGLQQNGEKPEKLSGVLVSDQPLTYGGGKAVYLSEFPVLPAVAAAVPSGGAASGSPAMTGAPVSSGSPQATGGSPQTSATAENSSDGHRPPLQLIAVLGFAFIGGLILNLMPCVLPVLSLKVFSLMRHAGENPKAAWIQGAAFTAGVVLSFWVLAGLLIALRTAGNQLGWGFQMQSPGFVLALIFLFFLLGLNLFGVFELGASLVGLDAKATGHWGGLASSFGNGALATVAATPCTAPFMGSSLGFAAQQPPAIALLIFTFLALGMAAPYLLLTIFPGALRFVPKPGAWMEAFKQFMGFLLMATVIFLVYVFGALVGAEQVPWLLCALLVAGLAAWVYGRWAAPTRSFPVRFAAWIVTLGLLGYAINWGAGLAKAGAEEGTATRRAMASAEGWQPWSPAAVDQMLAQGRPVFVDFTAAWCLSCKVNEAVALGTDSVRQAFAQKNVALFRADWTHSDPEISNTLRQYNRDGVPLYLLYSPGKKDAPQVLPEVLTPGIVLDALNKM